jgi:hypothetical protein
VKTGAGVVGTSAAGAVKLERPASRGLDDGFYRQVLRAYDDAASRVTPRAIRAFVMAPLSTQ